MKKLLIAGATTVFLGLTVASMSAQTQSTASSSTSYIETSKFIVGAMSSRLLLPNLVFGAILRHFPPQMKSHLPPVTV